MFPKAKLTRFNEVEGCAPPPGTYDPKQTSKLVGGVLSKTLRFPELAALDGLAGAAAISNSTEHLPKKTPIKTPKCAKPQPKSTIKKNILSSSSLTDLSKAISRDTEINNLKEEIIELKAKLDKSTALHVMVDSWVSKVEKSHDDSLKFILNEWKQFADLTDVKSVASLTQELESSHNELVELKAELAAQTEVINKLQVTVREGNERFQKLEVFMEIVNQTNNNLNNANEELERTKSQLQKQLLEKCDLMEELATAEEQLRQEISQAKSYGKSLEENYNTQCQEVRNLQMQVAALEELLEKKKDLESISKNLEEELQQSKEHNSLLQLNLASMESSLEIIRAEKSQLEKHLQEADQVIAATGEQLRLKNKEFEAKIDNVSGKAQFLESQMLVLQDQLKMTIEERDSLKNGLVTLEEQLLSLQEKHEETLIALASEMKLTQLGEEQVEKLKEQLNEVSSQSETNKEELARCLQSEKMLQQDLIESNQETNIVRDRIIALEKRLENLYKEEISKKYEKLYDDLNCTVEKAQQECEIQAQKLQVEVNAKEKLARKLTGTKALLKNTKEKLEYLESDLAATQQILKKSLERESKLKKANTELNNEISQLKDGSQEKIKLISELSNVNKGLKKEIEDVRSNLESVHSFQEAINDEIRLLVEQNNELNEESRLLNAQLKKKDEDLLVVHEELRGAKEHLQQHRREAEKNTNEVNNSFIELCNDLLNTKQQLEKEKADKVENLRKIASILNMTEFKENNALDAIESDIKSLYKYSAGIEEEYTKGVIMQQILEELLEEEKKKVIALQDQVFDSKQEIEDLRMNYELALGKLNALEEEKKILETECAYSQDEWADQERKLTSTIQLLSMEAQEAEDKQVQYEGEIMKLKDEITLLKDEAKWAEENQLKLEEEMTEILEEKERCIAKCSRMDVEMVGLRKQEEDLKHKLVASWEKAVEMAEAIHALKLEVNDLSELHNADATEMEYLDELVQEKDEKLEKQEEQLRLLRGQIEDQEAAMKRLMNEANSRMQAADEMEDLLQRKIAELGQSKDQISKLEVFSKSLHEKTIVLEENEAKAKSEIKKVRQEAEQKTRNLESQLMEMSSRWSNVEDSILSVENLESLNKELSANDSCLRSQVSILQSESQRLRSVNSELRDKLLELEKHEAKSSGHQNHQQKLSYLENLKEVAYKHEKNEEDMRAMLVASECRVAHLESELQKHGISAAHSKSMIVEGIASTSKKTRRGKENSLMASLSRTAHSLLSSSTPMHRKSPLQPKNI
ncbi:myosin-4-like [Cloeon dipterum]|uniref:myosin-4-like n=1 Tax=Cloeon dipterum TaxID=197152 RepID=UPI0032202F7D